MQGLTATAAARVPAPKPAFLPQAAPAPALYEKVGYVTLLQHVTPNVHFDHVDPALKTIRLGRLLSGTTAMVHRPDITAFVNLSDHATFATVYDAFSHELPKLAILCGLCHASKTFAESEIYFFRGLGSLDERLQLCCWRMQYCQVCSTCRFEFDPHVDASSGRSNLQILEIRAFLERAGWSRVRAMVIQEVCFYVSTTKPLTLNPSLTPVLQVAFGADLAKSQAKLKAFLEQCRGLNNVAVVFAIGHLGLLKKTITL
jgi:hypothetical protein